MRCLLILMLIVFPFWAGPLSAQVPVDGEVRQIVTFSFLPGKTNEAINLFRERAIPLYQQGSAMLSFRGFREVESPLAIDLMAVSAFNGMAGMDQSNEQLSAVAQSAGSSLGSVYGGISALSSRHTDQFVEMIVSLGNGDASARRLTAFVWYRLTPGQSAEFEKTLGASIVPWETATNTPSATGRFVVSDGWHYLRTLGFDSLGEYQQYWIEVARLSGHKQLESFTTDRREVIVASIAELSVR
jgi:hypothetical protein